MKLRFQIGLPDWLFDDKFAKFVFFLAVECKLAMILGEKLRDHRQILSEDFFLKNTFLATKIKFCLA